MKCRALFLIGVLSLLLASCRESRNSGNDEIVSQRYIHKYGYDVSKEEWVNSGYPGQVITTLRNGVTICATYEDGLLHGSTTYTFPHSNTTESLNIYDHGDLIKKLSYNIRGVPEKEDLYFSPKHIKTTYWYSSGTPKCIEEKNGDDLMEAEYYNLKNEAEFRVVKGSGTRVQRDDYGQVTLKETIENGHPILVERFHANHTPHLIIPYRNGKIDGEKKTFAESGEPLSIEQWSEGYLHGLSTYFQNGYKILEVTFQYGLRHGPERHFIDGVTLVEETTWIENEKHGPSTVYCDGMSRTDWFYNNRKVAKNKYDELTERERAISLMDERTHHRG